MIAKTPPTPERRIIAGLDFGATYSGLAWADTEHPERRETVTAWPGRHGSPSDKVPTRLRYAGDDVQWGFGIPSDSPREEAIEWFKLDLDPSLRSMKQAISNGATHRNVDTLMTDYISALVKHLTRTLTQELGREALSTPLELIATVPAIWTETAKHKTRQACQAASRKVTVHIVSEPEAAATYAIHSLDTRGLRAGDAIMVLDAGGGTVDLASHTIKSLEPLELGEAVPGTGALCGSAFLDLRFGMYLRAKLGGVDGFGKRVLAGAVDHFEKKTKREFTMSAAPDETFPIPVPGLPDNRALGIMAGHYALPAFDLHTIFEPVILEITNLVSEQVSSMACPPKTLLLVGGFGASEYLRESLKMALGKGVEVLRPPGAWRAVAQGAVMKGLAMAGVGRSEERREVKRYYGTEWVSKYDEKLHASIRGKRYWCGLDGCYKVSTMQWFTEKDHSSQDDPALETPFHWTAPVAKGRIRTVKLDIYACDTDGPPPLSRDPSVKLLRRVEADLSAVPTPELKRRRGLDGRLWYDLGCRIEAARGRGEAIYTLVYNGRRYKTV